MNGSQPVSSPLLVDLIERLCAGEDLDSQTTDQALAEIMAGTVPEAQTAGFLIALRSKGETSSELAGLARRMRELAAHVNPSRSHLVDTAGTGGGIRTFNVSTTAALIAAGAGIPMAKHGNRSATGPCGSADLLEQLGVSIDLTPQQVARSIDEVGFGFMFAPAHHAATRHVVPVRKALATRTAFNLLGPLTNPAGATRQVVGVSFPDSLETVAGALLQLGTVRAIVVHGDEGLDELSISGHSSVVEVSSGAISNWKISPEDVGLDRAPLESVAGETPEANAAITLAILKGERGAPRDIAVLNAGAAILMASDEGDIESCVRKAEEAIDSRAASQLLDRLIDFTTSVNP
jgi:anthranilate phosphoribosyltransferase